MNCPQNSRRHFVNAVAPLCLVAECSDSRRFKCDSKFVVEWRNEELAHNLITFAFISAGKIVGIRALILLISIPVILWHEQFERKIIGWAVMASKEEVTIIPLCEDVKIAEVFGVT